jgi:hypothetical protein
MRALRLSLLVPTLVVGASTPAGAQQPGSSVRELADLDELATCNSCHGTFRQEVVDPVTWERAASPR